MSVDSAFQRLRDANPVPDPDLLTSEVDLDSLLTLTPQRSEAMQTQEREIQQPRQKPRSPRLIAAAGAAVIALVVALVVLLPGEEVVGPSTPGEVVEAAYEAWSAADADAFFGLVADNAVWYGQPIETPAGQDALDFSWALNTTKGATFSEYECSAIGELDAETGADVVECKGFIGDDIQEAFGDEPASFTARYAVRNGQIVNAITFQLPPPSQGVSFYNGWLGENYGPEVFDACDSLDKNGEACADVQLQHLDEGLAAWEAEQG